MSHRRTLNISNNVAEHFRNDLVEAVAKDKTFRIAGDNINWAAQVRDQREDHHGHMEHAFGSIAIINRINFDHLNATSPQKPPRTLSLFDLMPTVQEMMAIKREYAIFIGKTAAKLIPTLSFVEELLPENITGKFSEQLAARSDVIPLPVLFLNEQKYQDVVQIMDHYEDMIQEIYTEAGKHLPKIHVGGDQLTRERFSGAKRLRAHRKVAKHRFANLGPITFELFHMMMNLLQVRFYCLLL